VNVIEIDFPSCGALIRYEASHIDRRHTDREELTPMSHNCTLHLSANNGFNFHNLSPRRTRMTFINCGWNRTERKRAESEGISKQRNKESV
jgi:hypothetical protein